MPVDTLPFFGQAFKTDGREFVFAVCFPEAACVSVAIKGQHESNDRPVILPLPVLRPSVLGQGDPSFGAKQESLRVSAFGIASFDGIARK